MLHLCEKSTTTREKVQRSADLAKAMKKLYNYRCQLCCPDDTDFSSPIIEKEDGTLYVEVHHITHISERDKVDDDSRKRLDTYENVVVVCTHHHKYLHYHHGGYPALTSIQKNAENQNLYKGYTPLNGTGRTDQVIYVIPTDNVDQDYKMLKVKGVCFIGEPQTIQEWYMRCVYFRDPEGNLFEICQDGVE